MKNLVRMALLAGCCFGLSAAANAQNDISKAQAAPSSQTTAGDTDQAARPGKGRTYTGGRRSAAVEAAPAVTAAQPAVQPLAGSSDAAPAADARIGRITGAGGKGGIAETDELALAPSAGSGACAAAADPAGGVKPGKAPVACEAKVLTPVQQDKGHSEKGIK